VTAALRFGELERAPDLLLDRGRRLAGGLAALGLREGDVVAVLLRNDPVYVDVIHACRTGGFYYCPLNWHFTAHELGYILKDSGARAVIGHADLLAAASEALPDGAPVLAVGGTLAGAVDYEAWLAGQLHYAGPPVSPRGHMAYTSGTTGQPKGVRRDPVPLGEVEAARKRMMAVMEASFGVRPGCRALLPAPLYHSAPSIFAQAATQVAELFVLTPRFDAEETLALIERHLIDTVYLVPIMYVRLLKLPEATRARHDLGSLRFVASTGAPCAPELKRAMIDWLGPIVHESYASSESGMVTAISAAESLARPGSVGARSARPAFGS
jgi:long-chain acyl-CoA synthetase